MKRFLLLFLAVTMLLLPLSACKKEENNEAETTAGSTEEGYYLDSLSKGDYTYEDFVIATIDSNCIPENGKENGNAVDDQLYKRDTKMEEYFDIEMKYVEISTNNSEALPFMLQLANSYSTGNIDCFIQRADNLMNLAVNGVLYDLNSVKHLDLKNDWWNQSMNDNLALNGKLYVTAGPIAQWYFGAPMVLAFNKTIMTNYNVPDIYTTVLDGNWTLEEMKKICKDYGIAYDADAKSGVYPVSVFSSQAPYSMYVSAGGKLCNVDENGISVSLTSDATLTKLENILEAVSPTTSFLGNLNNSRDVFITGGSLFWLSSLGYFGHFLPGSEIEYGIIPCPKADTQQKEYISCAWPESNFCFSIPSGLPTERIGWTGLLAEAYAFLAHDLVRPVKYESFVKYQLAADPIASQMMDTIFAGLYFDFNTVLNFGGSRDIIGSALKGDVTVSRMSGLLRGVEAQIKSDIAKYDAITKQTNE